MGTPYCPVDGKLTTGYFGPVCLGVQGAMFGAMFMADYDLENMKELDSSSIYNFYVGVALMMFVGFGYLMTFLKAYGLGAVGFTMYITCLGVQFAMIVENMMSTGMKWKLDFMDLLNGNFAVAAVLISFGGLIGKVSPMQLLFLTLMELICYCANKVYLLTNVFAIADCGGTIIIHVFGAYFGLAACATLGKAEDSLSLNGSSYVSDLFSLIGTVFLWLFWPSFVAGALPAGSDGHGIALVNTVIALLASTVVTFGLMAIMDERKKLGTVPVQNATLAGGVSIGATANLAMGPGGAMLIGCLAGALSCVGFMKPLIPAEFDTCGINNLHGMPGILGGLASIVLPMILPGTDVKPLNQLFGLLATLVVAGATGALTGFLMKLMGPPPTPFNDETYWDASEVPK